MINTKESSWYNMMGFSKLVLRNFVIACFILTVTTITTLASILNKINQERLRDVEEHKRELLAINKLCLDIAEAKNIEYVNLLKEALHNQQLLIKELEELEKKYQNKKR